MLPEYEYNWIKIMDFLLIANYLASPLFYYSYFSCQHAIVIKGENWHVRNIIPGHLLRNGYRDPCT